MPRQISINNIVSAILKGIEGAQSQYNSWSGGYWLWKAPEYLITTNIANQIYRLKGSKFITLENGTASALDDAGGLGKGRLSYDIRANGKIDILLWWADGTPRAIIEVKNQIYDNNQYEKDIKRIKKILDRKSEESTWQFGIFAFYDSSTDGSRKSSLQKTSDKLNNILERSKWIVGSDFKIKMFETKIHREDDSSLAGACLLIKQNKH